MPYDLPTPRRGSPPKPVNRKRCAVAAGGSAVFTGALAYALSPMVSWLGILLCIVTLALIVLAAMVLFSKRKTPSARLIEIINAFQGR